MCPEIVSGFNAAGRLRAHQVFYHQVSNYPQDGELHPQNLRQNRRTPYILWYLVAYPSNVCCLLSAMRSQPCKCLALSLPFARKAIQFLLLFVGSLSAWVQLERRELKVRLQAPNFCPYTAHLPALKFGHSPLWTSITSTVSLILITLPRSNWGHELWRSHWHSFRIVAAQVQSRHPINLASTTRAKATENDWRLPVLQSGRGSAELQSLHEYCFDLTVYWSLSVCWFEIQPALVVHWLYRTPSHFCAVGLEPAPKIAHYHSIASRLGSCTLESYFYGLRVCYFCLR